MIQGFAGFLASGSNGNCFCISNGSTTILIDAGISFKQAHKRLLSVGIDPSTVSAILITHEHNDHIKNAGVLSRNFDVPILATPSVAEIIEARERKPVYIEHFLPGERLSLLGFYLEAVPTPHDALEPVMFKFSFAGKTAGLVTDLGEFNNYLLDVFADAELLFLEANHELSWLLGGPYPIELKERVRSRFGHLSNDQCGAVASVLARNGALKRVVLAHLSDINNSPKRAITTVKHRLQKDGVSVKLGIAPRGEISSFYFLDGSVAINPPGSLPLEEKE